LSGCQRGGAITVYGGNDANTIDASALTASEEVKLIGGGKRDLFEFSAAGLTNGDTIAGGIAKAELLLTSAGTIAAGGVSGVGTFVLANGRANTLTLTDANFAKVAGATITIDDGNSGNRIDAGTLAAADRIVVHAGSGKDTLFGGAGGDVFYAGGATRMTGGGGADAFVFTAAGRNVVTDFTAAASDMLVFGDRGFRLGLAGATQTPKPLPSGLFVADATGAFTTEKQRFAYDTTTGQLFYDAHGSGSPASRKLVVTLATRFSPPPTRSPSAVAALRRPGRRGPPERYFAAAGRHLPVRPITSLVSRRAGPGRWRANGEDRRWRASTLAAPTPPATR
jgi:hypothetical protein